MDKSQKEGGSRSQPPGITADDTNEDDDNNAPNKKHSKFENVYSENNTQVKLFESLLPKADNTSKFVENFE